MRLADGVELPPGGAAAGSRDARIGIDSTSRELGEVDDDATVADRVTRDVVPPAPHRDRKVVLSCDREDRRDVVGAVAARDRDRSPVDERIERRTRSVVVHVVPGHDRAGEAPRCDRGLDEGAHLGVSVLRAPAGVHVLV